MSAFEKYAMKVDVALVAVMFGAYFTGYLEVARLAVIGFAALSFAMVAKIYKEQ